MVSVVVRCRNEERYVGYTIQSIYDYFGYDVEIIIVDNESTDNSIRVVNTFEYLNIKKVDIKKNDYTPGRALNLGVQYCTGDYVLILSAHCQITEMDFENDIKKKLDGGYVAVWGKQIPIWNGKKISQRYMWSNFKDKSSVNYYCKWEDRYFLHNAFAFYKRDTITENPFDEHWAGKEDRYWANDMIEKDKEIYYNYDMKCHHYYTDRGATWKGVG